MMRGIDLSFHKGLPDWEQVSQHVDFAILGVTQRYGRDSSFEHNYRGATSHGVKVGAYKYSYAKTKQESRAEAQNLLHVLGGRHLDLPIFIDMEWDEQKPLPMDTRRKIIRVFEKEVKAAGYRFGIYCNLDWYNNYIPDSLKNRRFWIAYPPDPDEGILVESIKPNIPMMYCWQYSWKGHLPGIDSEVDMDIWYGKPKAVPKTNAADIIRLASGYIGTATGDARHHEIIDAYNAHVPLAQGYRVTYTDSWCDAFVSALFIKSNAVQLIGGTECGVERHVGLFKNAGIWHDGSGIVPEPGDIIVFDWENDDFADHIGIVEYVDGLVVHTIEGNSGNAGAVMRHAYCVGDDCIRGYARPRYGE